MKIRQNLSQLGQLSAGQAGFYQSIPANAQISNSVIRLADNAPIGENSVFRNSQIYFGLNNSIGQNVQFIDSRLIFRETPVLSNANLIRSQVYAVGSQAAQANLGQISAVPLIASITPGFVTSPVVSGLPDSTGFNVIPPVSTHSFIHGAIPVGGRIIYNAYEPPYDFGDNNNADNDRDNNIRYDRSQQGVNTDNRFHALDTLDNLPRDNINAVGSGVGRSGNIVGTVAAAPITPIAVGAQQGAANVAAIPIGSLSNITALPVSNITAIPVGAVPNIAPVIPISTGAVQSVASIPGGAAQNVGSIPAGAISNVATIPVAATSDLGGINQDNRDDQNRDRNRDELGTQGELAVTPTGAVASVPITAANTAGNVAGSTINGVGNLAGNVVGATGNLAGNTIGSAGNIAGNTVGAAGNIAGNTVSSAGDIVRNTAAGITGAS